MGQANSVGDWAHNLRGRLGRVVIASGCESEGLAFEPQRLQATFDPELSKNNKWFPAKNSVPLMKENLQCAL